MNKPFSRSNSTVAITNSAITNNTNTDMDYFTSMCKPDEYDRYTEFRKIIHDTRNMVVITDEIMRQIAAFSESEKMEIIIVLNTVVETIKAVIDAD
jgi:hypothetical protein